MSVATTSVPTTGQDRSTALRGERKQITLSSGTIEYCERGSGRPIVFVHGFAVNGNLWRKVIPQLSEQYRCITPDLPLGAHRLPMNADADLSPQGVAALVNEFIERLELRDVILVGNDSGGAISQLLINRWPERIGHLVLTPCDAFERFPPPLFKYFYFVSWFPRLAKLLLLQPLRLRPLRQLPIAFGLLTVKPIEQWLSDEYINRLLGDPLVYRDAVKLIQGIKPHVTLDAAKHFSKFEKPVLLIWPPKNPQFTYALAERLEKTFPDATLEPVENARTFITEDQPEAVAQLIAKHCAVT